MLVGKDEDIFVSPKQYTLYKMTNREFHPSSLLQSDIIIAKVFSKQILICVKSYLNIYTAEGKILHTFEITNISLGKLAYPENNEKNNLLCISDSKNEGIVKIYDLLSQGIKEIKAHKSPIFRMCLNNEGNLLATCSIKGTIIRIFSIPSGEKLYTFRSGFDNILNFCLNFSKDSKKLISTFNNGFLYIFNIKEELGDHNNENNQNIFLNLSKSILPKDLLGINWPYISYKLNDNKDINLVKFDNNDNNKAFCLTSNGVYYMLNINYNDKTIEKISEIKIQKLNSNKLN